MANGSTFGERMLYVLWRWKGARGGSVTDRAFAEEVGTITPSYLALLKKPDASAPPPDTALAIAKVGAVDAGWLSFGSASSAAEPEGFSDWLKTYRENQESLRKLPRVKLKPVSELNAEIAAKKKGKGKMA